MTVSIVYEHITWPRELEVSTAHLSDWMKRAKRQGAGTVMEAAAEAERGSVDWRVAILDDDSIIRAMLLRRFRDLEIGGRRLEVRAYEDGAAFLEDDWHRGEGNCLLILDRMMPKVNGLEVLARLRAGDSADRYRIIMLTGIGEEQEIANAMRLGTDDYVVKPFRLPELEARMMRILQGKLA